VCLDFTFSKVVSFFHSLELFDRPSFVIFQR
jgi:hypothetical protein